MIIIKYKKQIEKIFADKITTHLSSYETADWAEGWKDNFKPIETKRFLVCPPWDLVETKGKQRIIIEPAMAFGTGQHATTQVCLELLENYQPEQAKRETLDVLDLGTGSGILAVAAKKEGFHSVDALDIEEDSVRAAKTNAELNHVTFYVEKNELAPFKAKNKNKKYDLIFANILLPVLVEVVPQMSNIMKPQGEIILSGLITSQREEMKKVCVDSGFMFVEEIEKDDWIGLRLRKKEEL